MRFSVAILAVCCFGAAAGVWAQQPTAQRTPDYYVRALQAAPPAGSTETTRGFTLLNPSANSKVAAHSSGAHRSAKRSDVLGNLLITFKLGSSDITPQGKAEATVFAKALEMPALATRRFEIGGYTDASGGPTAISRCRRRGPRL
jgi:outer membrane protein OmpA-like peptidoglycan-associated protein